jgi:hypothetical protein
MCARESRITPTRNDSSFVRVASLAVCALASTSTYSYCTLIAAGVLNVCTAVVRLEFATRYVSTNNASLKRKCWLAHISISNKLVQITPRNPC